MQRADQQLGGRVVTGNETRKGAVALRGVTEDDLEVFFEQQSDPDATAMAAFPARDRKAHWAHWHKILGDNSATTRAVIVDGQVAGNVGSWEQQGERHVGYWIGKSFWGMGVATSALSQFLEIETVRPLYAHVVQHNQGSIRVLQKCGFTLDRESEEADDGILELIMVLEE
jgi:RimJ/RimL family protein N-acetyltransferase